MTDVLLIKEREKERDKKTTFQLTNVIKICHGKRRGFTYKRLAASEAIFDNILYYYRLILKIRFSDDLLIVFFYYHIHLCFENNL